MLLEPGIEHIVDDALDRRPDFGRDELILGLRGKFRVGHFNRQNRGQTFAAIVAGQRNLFLAGAAGRVRVTSDLARECAAEAGEVSTAVALRDVVGEAKYRFVIAVVPPHRAIDHDAVTFGFDDNWLRYQRRFIAIEIFDERLDAALIAQLLALFDGMAHIRQHDGNAGIEERQFAEPMLQRGEIEFRHGEGFFGRQKRHFGAAFVAGGADDRERRSRFAVAKFHEMFLTVAPDRQPQPRR